MERISYQQIKTIFIIPNEGFKQKRFDLIDHQLQDNNKARVIDKDFKKNMSETIR